MKSKITVSLGYYFPGMMILAGGLACLMGVVLVIVEPLFSIPLLLIGGVLVTARYRLTINLTRQTYHDYLWIAGFKTGKKETFQQIECLYLNKTKYTQQVNSRASTMTRHGTEYNGYIKFDSAEIHLLSDDRKKKVLGKLEELRDKLQGNVVTSTDIVINAEILDYSEKKATGEDI